MYNLHYVPTTLGVQSWREIISGGTWTKTVEYHWSKASKLIIMCLCRVWISLYSHGTIIADIVVISLAFHTSTFTLLETAAHLVCGGPHELCIVAYCIQVVSWRAICEVVPLQEPCLDSKVPTTVKYDTHLEARKKGNTWAVVLSLTD
jgi:hypothetical protein